MKVDGVIALLKRECERRGSQVAFANHFGIAPGIISDVLNRRRDPTPQILTALNLTKVSLYTDRDDSRNAASQVA